MGTIVANKTDRVLSVLANGEELTTNELRVRFGFSTTKSVHAAISHLRREGNAIYLNERKNSPSKYRLGTPSRALVAAAAEAGYFS